MNILYAFNPQTATMAVAKYVLTRYDIEIKAQQEARALADDFAGAVLEVLTEKISNASAGDLQVLLSAGNTQGDDAGRIEALRSERDQFQAALLPAVKAQLTDSLMLGAPFSELLRHPTL